MNSNEAKSEWTRSWRVVVSAMIGVYVVNAYIYSLGPMMTPLHDEFGWRRQDISLGLLIISMISAVLSPLIGLAVDRFGARKVVIPGIIVFCGGLVLLSRAGPNIHSWWLLSMIVGVGYTMTTTGVWVPGLASHFRSSRGLAISLCIMGAGVAGVTLPYITTVLSQRYGWRSAYAILGGLCLTGALPITVAWFRSAGSAPEPTRGARAQGRPEAGLALKQIFLSRHYWQLAIASFLAVIGLLGLIVHFVPILKDAGMNPREAAAIAGIVGIGSITGRAIGGFFLDRIHGPVVGGVVLSIPVLVLILLINAGDLEIGKSKFLAGELAFMLGLALGSETDVVAYLASRYIGLRNYGFALGSITGFMGLGTGIGPWLGGLIFDRQHSYRWFEFMLCVTFGASVFMVSTLGRYPDVTAADDTS
jgi:predicted MFS family arabinose efflux permease